MGAESRFANKCNEPEFDSEAVTTLTLLFPPWGLGRERADFIKGIKSGELLIVGHRQKGVVVSFFIVDSKRVMRERAPNIALGRLPLREGKTLHVISWKEPQGDLMDHVRKAFPTASRALVGSDIGDVEFTMCV